MSALYQTPNSQWLLSQKAAIRTHMAAHKRSWVPAPPQAETDAPIRVFIRARPLLSPELEKGMYSVLQVQEPRTCHLTVGTVRAIGTRIATKSYDADAVFGPDASNEDVYRVLNADQAVERAVMAPGFDWTILMYGQTGTGKTYTATSIEERLTASVFGFLPDDSSAPSIKLSVYELRGPNAYDLLSDPPLQTVKLFTTDIGKSPHVSWHALDSVEEMKVLLQKAKESRSTRSTVKNDTSSRSHCVVNIQFVHGKQDSTVSTLHIIDLAGSERAAYSQHNDSATQKESISTNKSLAVLKDCIRARLDPAVKHVPWRGSRLTSVLRPTFEQGSKIKDSQLVVFACVSPSVLDLDDTQSTLKWIMPFQLGAADQHGSSGADGAAVLYRPEWEDWSHEESLDYVKRFLPKLAPLSSRLLGGEATIASLLDLSITELSALCSTPVPHEHNTPTDRQVKDAKVWVGTYHQKLKDLKEGKGRAAAAAKEKLEVKKVGGVDARKRALKALDGRQFGYAETGKVTRLDPNGDVVEALETMELETAVKA